MNWLDLALVVFIIAFVIIGIKMGFMNSILSHFSLGLNAFLSFFLCKPISFIYNNWFKVGGAIASSYQERLLASSAEFGANLLELPKAELGKFVRETINAADMSGLEKFMFKSFINKGTLYDELHASSHTSRTLGDIISSSYSTFFVTIISFVTSMLLLFGIILLFRLLVKKLREVGFVKAVDNTLGAIYGIFRAFLVLVGICLIIKLISPFNFMEPVTNYINGSLLGRFIYGQINSFFDNFLSFKDIIASIKG